ncbi:hypothetical protein CCACVL1_27849 [Corchorus capsularis]|uniref:Uncharacterized protein n=1 Tax=Corchorus capsularis TaxID=210143 RepID=A0A1R3G8I7_COCAP|nr:hypothetical protein CCACVL1_27849 [Corchorus capsularis]
MRLSCGLQFLPTLSNSNSTVKMQAGQRGSSKRRREATADMKLTDGFA